jgi:quercetin dioxygenase-like cupin family protein
MKPTIDPILFHTTDWSSIPTTEHRGKTGTAKWQTIQFGQLRMRLVEYSENYKANQWCKAGRILYCLDGEMTVELSDGRDYKLSKGMSYEVMDGTYEHRLYSNGGVRALIMDGPFLRPEKRNFNPWKM